MRFVSSWTSTQLLPRRSPRARPESPAGSGTRVRQELTEKEFLRRYVDRHQSLYEIAKQTGFFRQTLARLAAEYGIELREGPRDYKRKGIIHRDWRLFEQYVDRGRTLPDLAREKNMSTANMARWPTSTRSRCAVAAARATIHSCAASTARAIFLLSRVPAGGATQSTALGQGGRGEPTGRPRVGGDIRGDRTARSPFRSPGRADCQH